MANLRQIIEGFSDYIESADGLSVATYKGFPAFNQTRISLPVCALLYGGSSEGSDRARRVGEGHIAIVVTMLIYGSDEVNLFELAEKLQEIRRRRPAYSAGDSSTGIEQVRIYIDDDARVEPDEASTQAEQHVITAPAVLING